MHLSIAATFFAFSIFQHATAHYHFWHLMVNETWHPKWKYVRPALPDVYLPEPIYYIHNSTYRCGRNGTESGDVTDIATIVAGSKVGVRPSLFKTCKAPDCFPIQSYFHDGPLQAYLAKSPDQTPEGLKKWDADGDFFKIAEQGPELPYWFSKTYARNQSIFEWNFTIPDATPPGLYIMRLESIYPRAKFNTTQFFASCMHVQINGPGGAKTEPGPTVRFPGAFDEYHPGLTTPSGFNLSEYQMPGPKVWTG